MLNAILQKLKAPLSTKKFFFLLLPLSGVLLVAVLYLYTRYSSDKIASKQKPELSSSKSEKFLTLTKNQWSTLTIVDVETSVFRDQVITEGKISLNEDHTTPVFSPYTGRVTKLLVKPGDNVVQGQPLFVVEATDVIQALKDFVEAGTYLSKAEAHLRLMESAYARSKDLFNESAISQKDYELAEDNKLGAKNDLVAAQSTLDAARDRLQLLGKSSSEIENLSKTGHITSETVISAPISGTIVQRKVGPGQYVTSGSADPVFSIGDLSNVWLIAKVKETDISKIQVGQLVNFTVLSDKNRIFSCWLNYVAPSIDTSTRRLMVRAEVDNTDRVLRPEMFANVHIITSNEEKSPAVPREAIIYEGNLAHVWVVIEDSSIQNRPIKTGLISNGLVQVLEGLEPSDRIVSQGALFVDKISTTNE